MAGNTKVPQGATGATPVTKYNRLSYRLHITLELNVNEISVVSQTTSHGLTSVGHRWSNPMNRASSQHAQTFTDIKPCQLVCGRARRPMKLSTLLAYRRLTDCVGKCIVLRSSVDE